MLTVMNACRAGARRRLGGDDLRASRRSRISRRGSGSWDLVAAEARAPGRVRRARRPAPARGRAREPVALGLGSLYAATDEVHQALRRGPSRVADRLGDRYCRRRPRHPPPRPDAVTRTVAVDLDGALGDTRPLWEAFLTDAARRFASIAALDPAALPADRGAAASGARRLGGARRRRLAPRARPLRRGQRARVTCAPTPRPTRRFVA